MLRRATAADREALDEMTLAGVHFWGHHESHPEAYAGLLAQLAGADGPENHVAWVLENDGQADAFYELRDRGDHVELLRMFMWPELIGRGVGRMLWNHAVQEASRTHDRMLIMSDPAATGFYEAMGATLEKSVEVAPDFVLGKYWYDLTKERSDR